MRESPQLRKRVKSYKKLESDHSDNENDQLLPSRGQTSEKPN